MKRKILRMFSYVAGTVLLGATVVQAQDRLLVGSAGGVDVFRADLPSPGEGLVAFDVILSAVNPEHKLVTFENIKIEGIDGELSQVWLPGAFGGPPGPTPFVGGPGWAQLPPEWMAADTHIKISGDMVGGGAGGSHGGIGEENSQGNENDLDANLPLLGGQAPSVSGVGNLAMNAPTDAFFLDTPFQSNEVLLAHVVTAADGIAGLGIGILGEGIVNSGDAGGAQWGFGDMAAAGSDPNLLALVPEPASGLIALLSLFGLLALRRRS